jgi:hypothetical protein
VFDGAVTAGDKETEIGYTESGLVTTEDDVSITASEDSIVVAFSINSDARITRQGTVGR